MRAGSFLRLMLRPVGSHFLRIRTRLLLVNSLVVAVPLVGILVARFYEKEMLISLEDDMIHQAQLLRQVLLADELGLRLEDRGAMLRKAARETRTRIRLLDAQGALIADSHRQGPPEGVERPPKHFLPRLDSLSSDYEKIAPERTASVPALIDVSGRPEVKAALAGRYGSATRVWKGGDLVYLFCAFPITRNGSVEGVVYVTRTTVPVRHAMRRLRTTFLQIIAVSLAGTAILTLYLAGTISRPLGLLTHIAERFALGDRTRRLVFEERRDEIGQLSRAVDTMARRLDERARYVGELAANISHEFKSPLTGIRGATELLLEGAADDPAARARFLNNILADANRLDRLVTRLLELSRFEADLAVPELVDYEALVREVSQQRAAAHGVPVQVQYAAKTTQVFGRRSHLASALGNLVDNAQQHAAPGSDVKIRVSDLPNSLLQTTVHNQGAPISEANLARIWDRFFTTRGEQGGTGLGLPIVATVAAAHGGTVSVRSSTEEGTVFVMDLPRGA